MRDSVASFVWGEKDREDDKFGAFKRKLEKFKKLQEEKENKLLTDNHTLLRVIFI